MTRRCRCPDDTGAYLILYAMLVTTLFTVAAIVLDLAALRQGRRADRTTADLAASAGASAIDGAESVTFGQACERSWGYVLANRTEADGPIAPPACAATFPNGVPCDGSMSARTAAASIGAIQIEITHPVPDSSPLMAAETQSGDEPQAVHPPTDGGQCDRLGVRIVRTRQFLFGQIAGVAGGTTDVHSVARVLIGTSTSEVPGIVALERTGCDGIAVTPTGARLDVQGVGQAGIAIVDSDASTCSTGYTIAPGDPAQFRARPAGATPGLISSFALSGANFARAYDPAAVAGNRLSPTPTPVGDRTGRGIVEQRYNCTSGCPAGSDVINQLEAQLGGAGPPAGFTTYAGPCSVSPGPPLAPIVGNTYVDCPVFEVFGSVTFSGQSVVFAGDVLVRAGGCVAVNAPSCGAPGVPSLDGVAFTRGALRKENDASLVLPQTFVYAGSGVDIPFDANPSGFSSLLWSAPLAGPLEDLLLWSESTANVLLGEQEAVVLEGSAYAPNATIVLEGRGGGGDFAVPLQLVANRVRLQGFGDVTLTPAAGRATGRLTRQTRLIR